VGKASAAIDANHSDESQACQNSDRRRSTVGWTRITDGLPLGMV